MKKLYTVTVDNHTHRGQPCKKGDQIMLNTEAAKRLNFPPATESKAAAKTETRSGGDR